MSNDSLILMILIAFVSIIILALNTLRQNKKIAYTEFIIYAQHEAIKQIIDKIEEKEKK